MTHAYPLIEPAILPPLDLGFCPAALSNRVLQTEFPELAASLHFQLPDERTRRVGQAIAAASLPEIPA